jgi:hypothetical protein
MMFRAVFWDILPCKRSTIILHGSITQKTALNMIIYLLRLLFSHFQGLRTLGLLRFISNRFFSLYRLVLLHYVLVTSQLGHTLTDYNKLENI